MSNGLKEIRKDALINGLILGVILLVLDVLALYIMAHSKSILIVLVSILFGSVLIPLTAAILLIKGLRKKIGGYWTFRQATSGIFILFLSAYLLSSAVNFGFVKYIQPDITTTAKDNFVNVLTEFLDKINIEQDKIDAMVADIEADFEAAGSTNLGGVVSHLLKLIIILFVTALIFAALLKREHPIAINPLES